MKKKELTKIVLASNKKAYFDYNIIEKFEAGIVLSSGELKSCLAKHISLNEGYISIDKGQLILYNVHINSYSPDFYNKRSSNKETQPRILLMHKKEILYLANKVKEKGLTIIPLSFYKSETGFVKAEIALVKGKHNYDKRESLKEEQVKKDLRRYGIK